MQTIKVVANSKGGVGKTIVSTMILPLVFFNDEKNVNIYEIDDNNTTSKIITNSKVNFKSFKLDKAEDAIIDVQFDMESVNIVDCGGGHDTFVVLDQLSRLGLQDDELEFYIPTNNDIEQFDNMLDTIAYIQKLFKDSKIYIVFNRVSKLENLKDEFIAFFGSEKYGISGRYNELEQFNIANTYIIEENILYSILKNIKNTTLLDAYTDAKYLVENFAQLRIKWKQQGKEVFEKNLRIFAFAKDIVNLANPILSQFQGVNNG